MALTDAQLEQAVQQFTSAVGKGNTAAAQELIRQWNLTYTNTVADTYGQNFGVGQPAPAGAGTLAQGTATGGIGYIPGFSGLDASQSMANLSGQASTQQGAAGLTGFYTAPSQSQYTPGTFVRLDPNTYDTSTYGAVQLSYVLPSGQLQRVNIPQAQAMGWNGSLTTIPTIAAQQAMALEQAPPSQLPQQTLAGMTGYSNLNTAAMNNAVAQSGVTGTYQAPSQIYAPGTNAGGGKFSDLDPQTQRGYFVSNGGDWNAAMTAWVRDSNQAIAAASPGGVLPNQQGTPQRTLQAQNQYRDAVRLCAAAVRRQRGADRRERPTPDYAGWSEPDVYAADGHDQSGRGPASQPVPSAAGDRPDGQPALWRWRSRLLGAEYGDGRRYGGRQYAGRDGLPVADDR